MSADVVVVGAGVAGLTAAIVARRSGRSVIVLEKAPRTMRGGNTYFAGGGVRFAYDGFADIEQLVPDLPAEERAALDVGAYPQSAYLDDLLRITKHDGDPLLAEILVGSSLQAMRWLREIGVRFKVAYHHSFKEGDTIHFADGECLALAGGGPRLSDHLFDVAERDGIAVEYEMTARQLLREGARVSGVLARGAGGDVEVHCEAVVLASGGFEANPEMRARHLGQGWAAAKVRGTQFNTGEGINMALDLGAVAYGQWDGAHAIPWEFSAPEFGDRAISGLFRDEIAVKFNRHGYPTGIMVNSEGRRFVDEGADLRQFTFTRYGSEILAQPGGLAYQLFDQQTVHDLRDENYRLTRATKAEANSIEQLAALLSIDRDRLVATVAEYNAACQPGDYHPERLDGVRTEGIDPPKSNWALPLDHPPYVGFVVTGGITFTFGGLRIDGEGRVVGNDGNAIPNLFAAGELVGGLFSHSYPSGAGLVAGVVFGSLAGKGASGESRGDRNLTAPTGGRL